MAPHWFKGHDYGTSGFQPKPLGCCSNVALTGTVKMEAGRLAPLTSHLPIPVSFISPNSQLSPILPEPPTAQCHTRFLWTILSFLVLQNPASIRMR